MVGRHILPCDIARRFVQRKVGDRALGSRHQAGFFSRNVGGKLRVEFCRIDIKVIHTVAEWNRGRQGLAQGAAGEFSGQFGNGFTLFRGERSDIDQCLDIGCTGCGVADDRPAIGMTDQNDLTRNAVDK